MRNIFREICGGIFQHLNWGNKSAEPVTYTRPIPRKKRAPTKFRARGEKEVIPKGMRKNAAGHLIRLDDNQ